MANLFIDLIKQLKQALDSEDWDSLKKTDISVRQALQNLVESASEADVPAVVDVLERYQKIYTLILSGVETHRSEISSELQKITKESKVANLYLDSSSIR